MRKAALINGILLALAGTAAAVCSFWSLPAEGQLTHSGWLLSGQMVFSEPLHVTEISTAQFNDRDQVTLLPGSEATVDYDFESKKVTVELTTGSAIFATLADDFSVDIVLPFARVSSEHSTAVVSLENDTLNVYGVTHSSLVTFISEGKDLNALSVPGAYRMKIPATKVSSLLSKLRLTKLSKEFPVFALGDGDINPDATTVLEDISTAYHASATAFLNRVQASSDFGPAAEGLLAKISQGYWVIRNTLTVLPTAETHLAELRKEDSLLYAMTNFLYGDSTLAQQWLAEWEAAEHEPEELQELYSELFSVLPGEALYPVKAAVAQLLYSQEDPLSSLRRQFDQVESLVEQAAFTHASQAYKDYQSQFEAALNKGTFDDPVFLPALSREYTLLELLLRGHAVFYTVDSARLLSELENKIFLLVGTSQDLDEERQVFVQSKLRFLDHLFEFVIDKKLSLEEAEPLAQELIFDAKTMLASLSKTVAVSSYFESQLKEAEVSLAFMQSPEFSSYTDFGKGLAAYKTKIADLQELNAYIQNIRSGQSETPSLTEAAALEAVKNALDSHGISVAQVTSLGDAAHRLFTLKDAHAGVYSFTANYDRETQILYDVALGSVRFSTGLKLENVQAVFEEAASSPTFEDNTSAPTSSLEQSSLTESVALELVRSQFEDAGLNPNNFNFTLVSVDSNTFTFEGTMLPASVPISGSYNANEKRVSEVVWKFAGSTQTLPDISLGDFEDALQATYEALTQSSQ